MSVYKASDATITNKRQRLPSVGYIDAMSYRPSDWPALPSIGDSEQKIVMLFGVRDNDYNYIAFSCAGNYSVDWGDGSAIENVATGAKAQHNYVYSSVTSAVMADGFKPVFITITPQAGNNLTSFSGNSRYGSAGTIPYNANVLDMIMGSQYLTTMSFGTNQHWDLMFSYTLVSHGNISLASLWVGGQVANGLRYVYIKSSSISGNITDMGSMCTKCGALIYFRMGSQAKLTATSVNSAFAYCYSLKYVEGLNTENVQNLAGLFQQCNSIEDASFVSFKSATNVNNMFNTAQALRKVGTISLKTVTAADNMFLDTQIEEIRFEQVANPVLLNCTNMFVNCRQLKYIDYFDTSAVTNMSRMFNGCVSLETIPTFITTNVTNMSMMFTQCRKLTSIPLLDTSKVTTMAQMFQECYSLKSVPELDFSKVVTQQGSYNGMFSKCYSLVSLPASLASLPVGLTDVGGLFGQCYALKSLPNFTNTSNWTNLALSIYNTSLFGDCFSVSEIPAYNFTNVTNFGSSYQGMLNLIKNNSYNIKLDHSYTNCPKLDKTALNQIFDNLGSPAVAKTITITSTFGAGANPVVSLSGTTTSGSNTITMASTTGLIVGQQVTGTGITGARAVTFTDTGDTVGLTAHGIANGKRISFSSITSTTGIAVYTLYYVVNATANDFQLSLTNGGSAIALTTNGSGNLLCQTLITSITTNTSVTVDIPAMASGTATLTYRNLNTQIAVMKNWAVTG